MSEYIDLQSRFFYNICRFGLWLEAQGYQVGMGGAWRSDEEAKRNAETGKGIALSLHRDRMALDLVIRKDDKEVTVEEYKRCGEAWKSLSELNRYGGDFVKLRDYQHFSQTFNGRS
jgi:hypothetical protein